MDDSSEAADGHRVLAEEMVLEAKTGGGGASKILKILGHGLKRGGGGGPLSPSCLLGLLRGKCPRGNCGDFHVKEV